MKTQEELAKVTLDDLPALSSLLCSMNKNGVENTEGSLVSDSFSVDVEDVGEGIAQTFPVLLWSR